MRHLDALRGPLSAFAAVSALLLVLLGAVGAPVEADELVATGAGTAIGVPTADPNIYTVTVIAEGHSALLGKFRVRAHHFTDVSTGTGTFLDGAITFEGAHGRLFGTYDGKEFATNSPDTFTIAGTVTFVGGTGRFVGATGEADFTGELHIIGISPGGLVREMVTLELHGTLDF